jgi:hypothetical protein
MCFDIGYLDFILQLFCTANKHFGQLCDIYYGKNKRTVENVAGKQKGTLVLLIEIPRWCMWNTSLGSLLFLSKADLFAVRFSHS